MNSAPAAQGAPTMRPKLAVRELRSRDPMDPLAILEPAGSSPFGAAGMPPAESALTSPDGYVTMEVIYHNQLRPPLRVAAREVRRVGEELVFEGDFVPDLKGNRFIEMVSLRAVRTVTNLSTGVALQYGQELTVLQDESGPVLIRLAQLVKSQGEMLLRLSGHVRPLEYAAWEKDIDAFMFERAAAPLVETAA